MTAPQAKPFAHQSLGNEGPGEYSEPASHRISKTVGKVGGLPVSLGGTGIRACPPTHTD
jgi:hypothetical protein